MNLFALLAAILAGVGVTPISRWPAAIGPFLGVTDIGAVERVDAGRRVVFSRVNATASRIPSLSKITDVAKAVALRPDIAGFIHPGADTNA